ncbi:hypothetical protein [Mycoplasmopsis cynos]|uniref:hypothetical protein n=1 Tax=Mycoplasmopsis cynos TaxID=171284 RepID=UPI002207D5E2|nr:hypothetical protein [Mycoplasmopsis cynos]UWV92593.1 hypothetical protein NWE57_00425 [Mycoplasmopsis cynos]
MKDKKVVVWDLFGGGRNSVYKSLVEHNKIDIFDVYTFDVTEPEREKHFKLDLATGYKYLKRIF